jgi:hypothetical protein
MLNNNSIKTSAILIGIKFAGAKMVKNIVTKINNLRITLDT